MSIANFTMDGTQAKAFKDLRCSPSLMGGLRQESESFAVLNTLLSITACLGNILILVALHKESSLHSPSKLLYRCLATTDLLVGLVAQPLYVTYWISVVHEHWILCRYAFVTASITSIALCMVSLQTVVAISVDRLLALLLGLRYRQIVTLKRTYIIVAAFWVLPIVASVCAFFEKRVNTTLGRIFIPLCLVISIASYTKIFRSLSHHHQAQVQDQQPSQPSVLNMVCYRKAVQSALCVQLALVICYTPFLIVAVLISHSKQYSSHLVILRGITSVLIYFNSTLNPFLYCWKISEVRQAVKQTIRQALCCPWS